MVISLEKLNCFWLVKQNEYDLLVKIQRNMDGCVLHAIDDKFDVYKECERSVLDFPENTCEQCIQRWMQTKRI